MKKRLLKTITVLFLLCGFFVPVRVSADSQTYYSLGIPSDGCINIYNNIHQRLSNVTNEIRAVIVKPSDDTSYSFQLISLGSFKVSVLGYGSCPTRTSTASSISFDGVTVWSSPFSDRSSTITNNFNNIPIVDQIVDYTLTETAYYYTFGEGAVDPAPPAPDYGNLTDVRFNTDIAGSGTAAVNNVDHIKWNPENDSNGITFDGSERVEIQAIPGNYTASSKNSLLSLGVTDFDYNSGTEHLLAELPVENGEYTVSWSHVIQQLNAGSISDFLGIRKSSDTWLKSGWIYQIRLVAGDYVSTWQTIYNATSSGVQNSLTVENSTEINMELVNVIQSINTMNSSQYENWTINNITINMENSDGQQTTNKPWWAYLLEAIVKAFGDILAFLGNLIGDLMDAITDLFSPAEFTINEYNEFKVELKQNSGLFGQAIDFTNNLKNTFMGVQYQEPILHWQGISFDGIVFLPAADYNLNDYVEMWGLGNFRQIAYICSDGFIFFSLLLLIIRKLNEVLKK